MAPKKNVFIIIIVVVVACMAAGIIIPVSIHNKNIKKQEEKKQEERNREEMRQEIIKNIPSEKLNEVYQAYYADVSDGVIDVSSSYQHLKEKDYDSFLISPNNTYSKERIILTEDRTGEVALYSFDGEKWIVQKFDDMKNNSSLKVTAVYRYESATTVASGLNLRSDNMDYSYLVYNGYRVYVAD